MTGGNSDTNLCYRPSYQIINGFRGIESIVLRGTYKLGRAKYVKKGIDGNVTSVTLDYKNQNEKVTRS